MSEYLRRLAATGAAYTAASILSKLIAVALLPLYTRYLAPADYGAAEVLFAAVVAASIVVRLGLIEALLRFYYQAGESPDRVVSTSFAALFWGATAGALLALPFAGPISEALLDTSEPGLVRIAIGGLWVLTLFEYLLTLFRLEERARAYFVDHDRQRAGHDPGHGGAGGRRRRGRPRAAAGQLRRPGPPSSSTCSSCTGAGYRSSSTRPCWAACCDSASRPCRPSSRSTRSTSSTG